MKTKRPPYEIEFGIKGQEPSPYVSAILEDKIVLDGSKDELKALGLGGELKFERSGQTDTNQEFISIMLNLNDKGLAFSFDPKSLLAPSGIMMDFQSRGILTKKFKEISWRGPGDWLLTTYDLE